MNSLGGGMPRPNSMGVMTPSDSNASLGRNDSMNNSMGRNDSMNSMGRNDSMNSMGRNDSINSMGRSESMNSMSSMGRGDTVKYGSPMLPAFMHDDNFNPNERDKQVITYEWVSRLPLITRIDTVIFYDRLK